MKKFILALLILCMSYSLIGCGRNMGEEIALPSNTGTASEISLEAPSLMGQSIPLPEGMRSVTAQAYASDTHYIAGFGEDKLLLSSFKMTGQTKNLSSPVGVNLSIPFALMREI